MRFLVTGGCGFVGSAFVRLAISRGHSVLNLDRLVHPQGKQAVASIERSMNYRFVWGDICDPRLLTTLFAEFAPDCVVHCAAKSHVDRSIVVPDAFIHSNIVGTFSLLQAARAYWEGAARSARTPLLQTPETFRFIHISSDEVYGSLGDEGQFTEDSPYRPNSPYSASKAASDHLVRAWNKTYGLPTIITHSSNNYGPWQCCVDNLIPNVIRRALAGQPIPIHGDGQNVRSWIHVEDHAEALLLIAERGVVGETYNAGDGDERLNLAMAHFICALLQKLHPPGDTRQYRRSLAHVADRPGNDRRYSLDDAKLRSLGWRPQHMLTRALEPVIQWYVERPEWLGIARLTSHQMPEAQVP